MTPSVASHGHLLELVRASGGRTRAQLVADTGMSRGTLYARLDSLVRLGLVYEAESLDSTGGRPARRIRFEDRGRVVLAVDIGHSHARIGVTDLVGTELRVATMDLRVDAGDDAVLVPVLDRAERLLAAGSGEHLVGVGVGIPAAVDPVTGHVLHATTLPGWAPDAVVEAVTNRFGRPVVVENDARAAAVGECRSDAETLVFVKVATGIGCGIVVGGDVLRGAAGVAGDIGHVRVPARGVPPLCRCGRTGCLAAHSSGRALVERLPGIGSLSELVARAGERAVRAELDAAAVMLGIALATTVTTVNPHRVVLGGALGVLAPVVDGVRAQIDDIVTDLARPAVQAGSSGGRATGRGLARLVTRHVYSPAAVDAMIDRVPR